MIQCRAEPRSIAVVAGVRLNAIVLRVQTELRPQKSNPITRVIKYESRLSTGRYSLTIERMVGCLRWQRVAK